jgi:hypothetical protein
MEEIDGMKSHGEVKKIDGKRVATPEYRSWQMMRNRCTNPKCKDFRHYGGRGVTIDGRWNEFTNFLADMGRRPTPQHTLDRIDNNGPYSKANCAWATRKEQSRNKRNVKLCAEDIDAIRVLYAAGEYNQYELAKIWHTYQANISAIILRKSWA